MDGEGPSRLVKETLKAAIMKAKRIHTDDAPLYLPRIHPTVVRSGKGAVCIGRGSDLGRSCALLARFGNITLGQSSSMAAYVRVSTYDADVRLGERCHIASFSIVDGGGGVTIGNRVMVGNHCLISGLDHTYPGRESVGRSPIREQPIVIGADVWIGAFSLILAGVTIGEGAIVGSHSLVREDVPPFAVVAGQPARVVRMR